MAKVSGDLSGRRLLVIGLDPYRVPGPWDPQPVADAVDAGMAALADAGLAAQACLIGIDGSEDIEARITTALLSRPWDCVLVGGGIRKAERLLELFELIVNLVRRHAPQAEIAFSGAPQDMLDAVARRLTNG